MSAHRGFLGFWRRYPSPQEVAIKKLVLAITAVLCCDGWLALADTAESEQIRLKRVARDRERNLLAGQDHMLSACYGLTTPRELDSVSPMTRAAVAERGLIKHMCTSVLQQSEDKTKRGVTTHPWDLYLQSSSLPGKIQPPVRRESYRGGVEVRFIETVAGASIAAATGSALDWTSIVEAWAISYKSSAQAAQDTEAVGECVGAKRFTEPTNLPWAQVTYPRDFHLSPRLSETQRTASSHLSRLYGFMSTVISAYAPEARKRDLLAAVGDLVEPGLVVLELLGDKSAICSDDNSAYRWVYRFSERDPLTALRGKEVASGLALCTSTKPESPQINDDDIDKIAEAVLARYSIKLLPEEGISAKQWVESKPAGQRDAADLYLADFTPPIPDACRQGTSSAPCLDPAMVYSPKRVLRHVISELSRFRSVLAVTNLALADLEIKAEAYREDAKQVTQACLSSLSRRPLDSLVATQTSSEERSEARNRALYESLIRLQRSVAWHYQKIELRDFESMFLYTTRVKRAYHDDGITRSSSDLGVR